MYSGKMIYAQVMEFLPNLPKKQDEFLPDRRALARAGVSAPRLSRANGRCKSNDPRYE